MSRARSILLALRFALREMRGGLSGFYIFLACIALGVAAIGGVNSVARSVTDGIAAQGRTILGGDISFALNQREAVAAERAFIAAQGRVAESATMRSMARLPDGSDQSLVEVKAVDAAYPLYGDLQVTPRQPLAAVMAERNGVYGAAVTQDFLDRMNLRLGAKVLLGSQTFELRALIENEPDLLSSGFNFAPRFLTSLDGLRASGLIQPGSLVNYFYKVALPGAAQDAAVARVRREAMKDFPDAGWNIRTRANAAPSLRANIERFSQFLTLVGLGATLGLVQLIRRTAYGRAWRAVSEDERTAALFGVDPRAVRDIAVIIACALCGMAGVIVTVIYGGMGFAGGFTLGLKALVAAILGGIGSVPGAALGGLFIAGFEAIWSATLPIEQRDLAVYLLLAIVLIWRPGGFFGDGELTPRQV